MARKRIVKILLFREIKRLQKSPSALAMLGLLTAVAFLMAIGRPDAEAKEVAAEDMGTVVVIVDRYTDEVQYVQKQIPEDQDVRFELRERLINKNGRLVGPRMWHIVEWRNHGRSDRTAIEVQFVGETYAAIQPFLDWFHPALHQLNKGQPWMEHSVVKRYTEDWSSQGVRNASIGDLMKTEVLGTTLLLMVQFFTCCHLLVSFTAQDREQRTLSALALTTASLSEIMIAKAIFHLTLSVIGSTSIVLILQAVLIWNPVFWITLVLGSVSTMCVGTCIATLAKNQSAAGMLALCYMMAGAILFFLASKLAVFAACKALTVECYSFLLLLFAFKHPEMVIFLRALIPMILLTAAWIYIAKTCFFRFGWK